MCAHTLMYKDKWHIEYESVKKYELFKKAP